MTGERILVVDDESQIVRFCAQALIEEGYTVQGATSGLEAIAYLELESFDVLVVDVKMPDVDGLTVLRQGRASDPLLTAVVITGYATMDSAIEALSSGARGFVLKPFGIQELISAVSTALAQRQMEQERQSLQAQLPILELSQALMTEGNVESLAGRLLEVVARQMVVGRAVLALLDKDADELHVAATVGLPDEVMGITRLPIGQSVIRRALLAEGPLVLDAQSWASLEPSWRTLMACSDIPFVVVVPLRTGKRDVGLLTLSRLSRRQPEAAFSLSDMNLLSIVGRQIAIALENVRMYAMEQQRAVELARALEQQQELDRLKDEFIQNVSHELRTPLSMILGYAELLVSGELGKVETDQERPLNIIVERAQFLSSLVENITALLANQSREPLQEPVSMTELVGAALADFQVLAEQSGLALRGETVMPVPLVLGDPDHLRKVVDNLIGNALKFTPTDGTVDVSLRNVDQAVILEVTDTGIGIAEEHLERIFDRFYQIDGTIRRTYGGSGLGLALVKEIVESHGGRVMVESQPGQGSTFTVELPVATTAQEAENA